MKMTKLFHEKEQNSAKFKRKIKEFLTISILYWRIVQMMMIPHRLVAKDDSFFRLNLTSTILAYHMTNTHILMNEGATEQQGSF